MFVLYNLVLLFSISCCFLVNNWLVLWVFIELSTMMIVLIVSECGTPRAVEAASKYFVIQAVASSFLLMGILSHFLVSGGFFVFGVYDIVSYFLFFIGIFTKMAVLPSPFWFVDVVSGVNLFRAFYVMVASKVVPIYLFVCLSSCKVLGLFLVVGLFSVFLGSVLGVNQISIRKILAFSSIAHMGWMVSCFPNLASWYCVTLFLCYLIMLLPVFLVSVVCSLEGIFKRKNSQFYSNVGSIVVVSLLSLGGLPPLVGFFYKWAMLLSLTGGGLFLVSGFLVLLSLVSLYYYLNVSYSLFSLYWGVPKVFSVVKLLGSKSSVGFFSGLNMLVIVGFLVFLGPVLGVWLL